MKWMKRTGILLTLLFAGPAVMLTGGRAVGSDWRTASRESTGLAPDPATTSEPVIQVYAARTYGWRGAFGVHTWIAAKPTAASSYTVYQVIGWRARYGSSALVVGTDLPDRQWFGNSPEVIAELCGDGVGDIIKRIDQVVACYPYANTYTMYPGPNSNTFTAWIGRHVPELKLDLPPTAIGKDYLGDGLVAAAASGTGFQISVLGLLGLLAGVEEGLEINLAGLTFGVDPLGLALKLPGFGRIGPRSRFDGRNHARNDD
jgi:hypothetical protein